MGIRYRKIGRFQFLANLSARGRPDEAPIGKHIFGYPGLHRQMTLRDTIHQEYRDVVERRVFTVTGARADEETIERLIETGDSEFQKAIQEQGRGQIINTLAEIQERHDAVRDLERKLLDLQQIFLDMAVLVDAQGDLLNNIETQVFEKFQLCKL